MLMINAHNCMKIVQYLIIISSFCFKLRSVDNVSVWSLIFCLIAGLSHFISCWPTSIVCRLTCEVEVLISWGWLVLTFSLSITVLACQPKFFTVHWQFVVFHSKQITFQMMYIHINPWKQQQKKTVFSKCVVKEKYWKNFLFCHGILLSNCVDKAPVSDNFRWVKWLMQDDRDTHPLRPGYMFFWVYPGSPVNMYVWEGAYMWSVTLG
jgi:hypothetical protein